MTGVTNPVSRDPSVSAGSLLTLREVAPRRVMWGIGTGDSAAWGAGLKPGSVRLLREYILAVRGLISGETVNYGGRTFRMQRDVGSTSEPVPIIVACAGPRVLRMAAKIADGMIVSMGFAPENIEYVRGIISSACAEIGRDPDELDIWWNTEVVFADTPEKAMQLSVGAGIAWLGMTTLEGKQIPEELHDAVRAFGADMHDFGSTYHNADRQKQLADRAEKLGLRNWSLDRSPGLCGTPTDVVKKFREWEAQGLTKWTLYAGRKDVRAEEYLPQLWSVLRGLADSPVGGSR